MTQKVVKSQSKYQWKEVSANFQPFSCYQVRNNLLYILNVLYSHSHAHLLFKTFQNCFELSVFPITVTFVTYSIPIYTMEKELFSIKSSFLIKKIKMLTFKNKIILLFIFLNKFCFGFSKYEIRPLTSFNPFN